MDKVIKNLAIIPARIGSKGIVKKNLIQIIGRPLVQYTIEAALDATKIDKVLLSSDGEEILKIGENCNVDFLRNRPAQYSTDIASRNDVVLDAISFLNAKGYEVENIVYLQPTSPLRTASDIDDALNFFQKNNSKTLFSGHHMHEHPFDCMHVNQGSWVRLVKPGAKIERRQDYEGKFIFDNGAIYIFKADFFKEHKTFYDEGKADIYEMSYLSGFEIDNHDDLFLVEALLNWHSAKVTS